MATRPITVLAFGSAVEALGWPAREFTLADGVPLGALVEQLERDCPRLAAARGRLRYAVNQQYATLETALQPGDEVAIIPPVAGGEEQAEPAHKTIVRLVREPIDTAAVIRETEHSSIGAVAIFLGVVRQEVNAHGQSLHALEYSAYEPMALAEMRRLAEAIAERHPLHKAALIHRLGPLKIGETSVAVVASAAHRAAACDACRALIEELKAAVPIFKRELWQDGKTSWVHGV